MNAISQALMQKLDRGGSGTTYVLVFFLCLDCSKNCLVLFVVLQHIEMLKHLFMEGHYCVIKHDYKQLINT